MPYLPKGARIRRGRGMGQVLTNVANPYPGSYSDVNCPTFCFLLGNGLDMAVSQSCWPCHNICANGTAWDSTQDTCVATPGAVAGVANLVTPAGTTNPDGTTAASCPGYCSWLPFASSLFTECGPCAGAASASGLSSTAWIGIGVAAVIALYLLGGRR